MLAGLFAGVDLANDAVNQFFLYFFLKKGTMIVRNQSAIARFFSII